MFRSMRITVNGKTYDVTVEETGNGSVSERPSAIQATGAVSTARAVSTAPAVVSAAAAVSAPAVSAALSAPSVPSAPAPVSSMSAGGAGVLKAPIPGTVTSIKVTEGQNISTGDVVLLLEAMKMENEICAHTGGIISRIFAQTGTMVNTGDPLLEIS